MSKKTKYPIYIISKGRSETRLSVKALEEYDVGYFIVIEPQEYDAYKKHISEEKIITLPFSNLGQGSIPARNFCLEHSKERGSLKHWIVDDNIKAFRDNTKGKRTKTDPYENFSKIERITDKYNNVKMAGMQYSMFAVSEVEYHGKKLPPIIFNTRIYSCILLSNDIGFRWRGRYNEDTDLSLRLLKNGNATMLFNAYTCDKQKTMTMSGGNTESLYLIKNEDGRHKMAESLYLQHPDCVKIGRRYNRYQHIVDYRKFKTNKLICEVF